MSVEPPPGAQPRNRLARLGRWLGQRWCGLRCGHHYILTTTTTDRVALLCWYCDHESRGWTLTREPEEP